MKRRTGIRILSFLCALLAALGGLSLLALHRMRSSETRLAYANRRALEELRTDLENIRVFLCKSRYTATPARRSVIAAELYRAAGSAKSALAQLPAGDLPLPSLNRFLSQVGDFSLCLSKRAVAGEEPSDGEFASLRALGEAAETLSAGLLDADLTDRRAALAADEAASAVLYEPLEELEESLTDTPTLVYDGPFSDHILTRTSELLAKSPAVSAEQARWVAAKLAGVPVDALHEVAGEAGKTPAYGFATDDAVVQVTKQGGFPLYYRKTAAPHEKKLDAQQAVARAKNYAAGLFDGSFVERYFATDGGVCVVNLAHKEGETICYTDLIKVGVALDTGEVVLLEARGYLMNHRDRTVPRPVCTRAQAEQKLSSRLRVRAVAEALIPSGGDAELPCYEFYCTGEDGEDLLVYLNTQNGGEEAILLLQHSDNGTLAK